jgi:tRNA threonylcarbamoyladenosine biosynthesis protein TsaB
MSLMTDGQASVPYIELAVQTSLSKGEVCLLIDNKVVDHIHWSDQGSHSEWLSASVQKTLQNQNLTISEVQHIYCATGPGSFTGIRVGVSFCRALSHSLKCPVTALNTLDLLASQCLKSGSIVSMIDAQKNSVFLSKFERTTNNQLIVKVSNQLVPIDELHPFFQDRTYVCGQAFSRYQKFLDKKILENSVTHDDWQEIDLPLYFSQALTQQKIKLTWQELLPFYIKKSAPEELLNPTHTN